MKTNGFKYGKYVIRARLPKGKHLWPAIWMLPTKDVYGTWAASGEIVIMEYRGQNTSIIEGQLHFGGKWPNNRYEGSGPKDFKLDFSQDFHEFSIEWDSNEIRWYVDSNQYHSQTLKRSFWSGKGEDPYNNSFQKPFDQPFQFVLNVAVGGSFFPVDKYGVLTLEEAKNWPKPTLEIDFIKVYHNNSNQKNVFKVFNLLIFYTFIRQLSDLL
jgi:beta-glucanase (GH16 family)